MRRTSIPVAELSLVERLRKAKALGCLAPAQLPFVDSLIAGHKRYGSWTPKQEASVHNMLHVAREEYARRREAAKAPATPEAKREPTPYAELWQRFNEAVGGRKQPVLLLRLDTGHKARITRAHGNERFPDPVLFVNSEAGYLGRITRDGQYVGRREADPASATVKDMLSSARAIRAFLKDPSTVASAYGRETGSCCFCARELTDPRSVKVGYGPICAGTWNLPHGANA